MFRTVAAALITDGDKFMICRRPAYKARGLLWEFPGGKTEEGETPEQALIREIKEELDADIKVGQLFTKLTHVYPDLTIELYLFKAELLSGYKMLEHCDIKWITPFDIDGYEFCPADKDILALIKQKFNIND